MTGSLAGSPAEKLGEIHQESSTSWLSCAVGKGRPGQVRGPDTHLDHQESSTYFIDTVVGVVPDPDVLATNDRPARPHTRAE